MKVLVSVLWCKRVCRRRIQTTDSVLLKQPLASILGLFISAIPSFSTTAANGPSKGLKVIHQKAEPTGLADELKKATARTQEVRQKDMTCEHEEVLKVLGYG